MSKRTISGLVIFLSILYGVNSTFHGTEEPIEISDDEQPSSKSDGERLESDEEPEKRQKLLHEAAEEMTNKKLVPVPYSENLFYYWPLGVPIKDHEYVEPLGFSRDEVEKLRERILKRFNEYRLHHEIELFEINEKLNNSAQQWANTIGRLQNVQLMPVEEAYYGETMAGPLKYDDNFAIKVVDLWYSAFGFLHVGMQESEFLEENLNPNENPYNLTQMLWKQTKEIGVGVARNESSKCVYVCVHYYPPGNLTKYYLKYLPEIKKEDIEHGRELMKKYSTTDPIRYCD